MAGDDFIRGACIVVIDDNRHVLQATHMLLESWGALCVAAQSVADAQFQLSGSPARPDPIIADNPLTEGKTSDDAIRLIHE